MEASALSSMNLRFPLASNTNPKHARRSAVSDQKRPEVGKVFAIRRSDSYGWDYRGQLVDENMIVLRKRIHEMKMIERNYEPPSHWMEWEKQHYSCYDENICKVLGMLQSHLINTRPSTGLAVLALIATSVPTSAVLLALRIMEAATEIISAAHGA
ncbi:hypothetical protein Nepgr_032453 [Nepenthes gracilis]|uniref:Uncharacterized protein n=1 Tax=Nepenthes gracilis TaxID=150966 RepID=A0AAD3TJA4_NEPGR|nr:hypothetical protein Nepgr_032453 [Nepenthes gracilis]